MSGLVQNPRFSITGSPYETCLRLEATAPEVVFLIHIILS